MKYENTIRGRFIERPNRFIAAVEINGKTETAHVKNTGRCRELLTPGATVILQRFPENSPRKTKLDLIAVYKENLLINMDSQSPNKAAAEFIPQLFSGVTLIRPETKFGNSRFDFYIEAENIPEKCSEKRDKNLRRIFMEVKGCTLEADGVCRFPDAPTERGRKHLDELARCIESGYEAYVLFVIQMSGMKYFTPNYDTDPEFGEAHKRAVKAGVTPLAYSCKVTEDSMVIDKPVKIVL
ncbi:MAG: DNA/RNA nuclease SfsA [Oscillospiraceae bacterium]|nr:DNA/RNA nuclease SfsA [Oscillospiraceae bacterium]